MPSDPEAVTIPSPETVLTPGRLKLLSLLALTLAIIAMAPPCVRRMEMAQYVKIFEDMDTAMPSITVAVMRFSAEVYIALCAIVAVLLVLKEWRLRDKGLCLVLNVGATWFGLVLWVLVEQAIALPMFTLIQSVSR